MQKIFFIIIAICVIRPLSAQQEQQFSQYLINPFTINPAVSSTEDYMDVQMGHRTQWFGIQGSPTTTYLTAFRTFGKPFYHMHYKGEHKNWHGAGIHVFDDRIGPFQRNSVLLAYSYNMAVTKKTRLSLGSFLGTKQIKANANYWENIEDNSDLLFAQNQNSGFKPEMQLGLVLYSEDYFATMAVHNLVGQDMGFYSSAAKSQALFKRHAFVSAGYHFNANPKFKVTPSFMIKYVANTPMLLDLNLKVDHQSNYWYGFSTRLKESVNLFAGVNLKGRIDVSYAFEWSFSQLKTYNTGTHEIIIGLRFQHPNTYVEPSKYW